MFRLKRSKGPVWKPYALRESVRDPGNPYRGFYSICRMHADSEMLEEHQIPVDQFELPDGQTMVLLEINLQHFRSDDLSPAALDLIDRAFRHFDAIGASLILRFMYDWEGQGAMHEPATLGVILRHMEQLAPMLHAYGALIYIVQGLFIGSWGEMHNTRYTSQSDLITLAAKLAECTSPHTYIALRCPHYWRMIFRTYSPASFKDVLRGNLQARFCLFNDALLGSDTDLGTYGTLSRSASTHCSDKLNRYEEINFQNQLCRYVPNGGEVIRESPLNDIRNAVRTLSAIHLSYLNSNYDRAVLDKWRNGSQGGYGGVFRKASDYDYIAAHLGYRFHLLKSDLVVSKQSDTPHELRLTLVNKGFSACYRPLNVSIVLCHADSDDLWEIPLSTDTRTWQPDEIIPLHAALHFPISQESIRCLVGLRIQCPLSGQEIRLANTAAIPDAAFTNPIGELML